MIRDVLYDVYKKLQRIIAPGLTYSQDIYQDVLDENCLGSHRWLDLGCGHNLLSSWKADQENDLVGNAEYIVGLDYDLSSLKAHRSISQRVRSDITKLPFPDNSFDMITSNMVFEHLEFPEIQLKEISRILSPGGKLIFHTPNNLGYTTLLARLLPDNMKGKVIRIFEGRKEEDVFKTYYKINSFAAIREMADIAGLRVVKMRRICSSAQSIIFPPFVIFELLWIRLLMTRYLRPLRTNIISILEKPDG